MFHFGPKICQTGPVISLSKEPNDRMENTRENPVCPNFLHDFLHDYKQCINDVLSLYLVNKK